VALYHGFKVMGYAGQNQVFSQPVVNALRTIKFCAMAMVAFVAGAELFILMSDSDDRAGGIVIGGVIAFGAIVVAIAAATFARILQNAVNMKSKRDLTV
jgi:hypothetical protein